VIQWLERRLDSAAASGERASLRAATYPLVGLRYGRRL